MRLTLLQLVLLGAALVAAMACAAALVLRDERRAKRVAGRLSLAVTPYARVNVLATMGRDAPAAGRSRARLGHTLAAWFGHDPARADQLPCPVWAVFAAAGAGAAVAALVLSRVAGSAAWLAVPPVWVIAGRALFGHLARRRAAKLYLQFPDALGMIVRSVRVGIPVSEAIRAVAREASAPTGVEFTRLSDQVAVGVALEDALRDLAARSGLPEYRFFATALSLQAQTGGALAEMLDNLGDVIRKRVAARGRAHALASEARTSSYVLAALPVVTGGGLAVLNFSYIQLLFTDPVGNMVLAAAVGMLGTGMGVMRLIIARSLR